MNQTAIFWPMIVHVALVYGVYVRMSFGRQAAIRSGKARVAQFRENRDEPDESLFARNNLQNQFELPVLFHVVGLALYSTAGASLVPVVIAWIFVLSRVAHAAIHLTTNRIRHRRPLFLVGFFSLAALWAWFALHLLGLV